MEKTHDPVRQLKYLRQTLSQNKNPLGIFLSAGCPLAVKMPENEWPLIPDIAGLTEFVNIELKSKDEKKNTYDKLIVELIKTGIEIPNIEEILSFVRGLKNISKGAENVRGFTEAELEKLEKDISKKIVEKVNVELPNSTSPYHQLSQWVHLIDRGDSPIECFTTNYDLLAEQAFEETGVAYFDGFVGSKQPFFDLRAIEESLIPKHWTRLWKIHGSINWFLNDKDEVYRSTDVNSSDSYIIHPSHLKYDETRKMPYLALIDRLNTFLRQTSAVLITTGYSFNDNHLNVTIVNALKSNPTAMVIALLYDTYKGIDKEGNEFIRYEKAFKYAKNRFNLSAWTFDEAVIGGQQGKWKVSKAEDLIDENVANAIVSVSENMEESERDTNKEDDIQYQLQLGDFSKFGNFLQALIGDAQFKIEDV